LTAPRVKVSDSQVPTGDSEEKKELQHAFLKFIFVISLVSLEVFLELVISCLLDDVWLAILGLPLLLFLLLAVPFTIGEYPFFSERVARRLIPALSPGSLLAIFFAVIFVLSVRAVYVLKFSQLVSIVAPLAGAFAVSYLAVLGGVVSRFLRGFVFRKRLEIMFPKWASFSWKSPMPDWIISSDDMMRRAGGLPIIMINNSGKTLIISQIWLEWFAYVRMVPKAFHRRFMLRTHLGESSLLYYQEVRELEGASPALLKPREAMTWVLPFQSATSFDRTIRERNLVSSRHTVDVNVTVYDEYSDRIQGSRELVLLPHILIPGRMREDMSRGNHPSRCT